MESFGLFGKLWKGTSCKLEPARVKYFLIYIFGITLFLSCNNKLKLLNNPYGNKQLKYKISRDLYKYEKPIGIFINRKNLYFHLNNCNVSFDTKKDTLYFSFTFKWDEEEIFNDIIFSEKNNDNNLLAEDDMMCIKKSLEKTKFKVVGIKNNKLRLNKDNRSTGVFGLHYINGKFDYKFRLNGHF